MSMREYTIRRMLLALTRARAEYGDEFVEALTDACQANSRASRFFRQVGHDFLAIGQRIEEASRGHDTSIP